MIDNSNLYLNLSNKASYLYNVNQNSLSKAKDYKVFNYLHTTGKSAHQTGANLTYIECARNKNSSKRLNPQKTHDLSVDSYSECKSHAGKRKYYSEFDEQSERGSKVSDFRPSIESNHKLKNIRPGVIKGFCSSVSSLKSEADQKAATPEKEIDMKQKFYSSGIAFYHTDDKCLSSPAKDKTPEKLGMSQKQIPLYVELNAEEHEGIINRTHTML